jgi:hypothetical protein
VTKSEWLHGSDPTPLLGFLWREHRLTERKGRLFAAACCRRAWHLLNDRRSERAVEVVERWADGKASRVELAVAHEAAWQAWGTPARTAASDASVPTWSLAAVTVTADHAAWADLGWSRAEERKAQADLLRCLLHTPLGRPLAFEPGWLGWNGDVVRRLAESMYEQRAFERLGVLADALEEAGCADPEVLGHCRGPGPHARGCWVVDLLAVKE